MTVSLEDWYGTLSRLAKNPGSVNATPCPNCHKTRLVYAYIRDGARSRPRVIFYCSNCMVGVPSDPGQPPEGMDAMSPDELNVPNFRFATSRLK
jgi:hypothetical protein